MVQLTPPHITKEYFTQIWLGIIILKTILCLDSLDGDEGLAEHADCVGKEQGHGQPDHVVQGQAQERFLRGQYLYK